MKQFEIKVEEVKTLLAQGRIDDATEVLQQAWNFAGRNDAKRTVAHDLGNQIQRVIFEQYFLNSPQAAQNSKGQAQ